MSPRSHLISRVSPFGDPATGTQPRLQGLSDVLAGQDDSCDREVAAWPPGWTEEADSVNVRPPSIRVASHQ